MNDLVIKCGGSVLEEIPESFFENIIKIKNSGKWNPILVHGGGPLISKMLESLEIKTEFVDGLRVTTNEVLDVVEMVLSGVVNKQLVRKFIELGGSAFGISGVDGSLLKAQPISNHSKLGFVGEVVDVKTPLLTQIINNGFIPIVSPLGINDEGQRYNINGDLAAAAVAKSLKANLCMVTNIDGIYSWENGEKVILHEITKQQAEALIEEGVIRDGMIPKVNSALEALLEGVPEVTIINGSDKESLIKYCEGKKVGTKIVVGEESQVVFQ